MAAVRSILTPHIHPPSSCEASSAFRTFGLMREGLMIQAQKTGPVAYPVGFADGFATRIINALTAAAKARGYKICELEPIIILSLPGGSVTPYIWSVVLGLKRQDGKISPVVFSPEMVLVQTGHGFFSSRYDHTTDFDALIGGLRPASFV
jgi:hypothetical protein